MRFLSLLARGPGGRRYGSTFLGLTFLLMLAALPGFGQTDNGSIVGRVRDASGAVIVGAQVDITDNATGVTRTFTTNGDGEYQALQLIPGVYTVRAGHQGYSTGVLNNVTVNVQSKGPGRTSALVSVQFRLRWRSARPDQIAGDSDGAGKRRTHHSRR